MPVLPLVGSMITDPLSSPRFSASSIIATPIRSLTLESGLNNSSFAKTVAFRPCRNSVQLHQRRVADGLGDIFKYPAHFISPYLCSYFFQCLFDIGDDVIDMLDADREPDKIGRNAGRQLFFG